MHMTHPGRPPGMGEPAKTEKAPGEARAAIEPPPGAGCAARLDATLWDLIQFECQRRARRSVRITSRGMVGFVHFRDGNVVHASTARQGGVAAVREMLEWKDGVFETWNGAGPERDTITSPW